MTIKIMQAENNLKQEELDFFVKGNISLEKSSRKKPYPWLSEQGWQDILKLCTVATDVFASLADDIERNEQVWKEVNEVNIQYYLLTEREACTSEISDRQFSKKSCECSVKTQQGG